MEAKIIEVSYTNAANLGANISYTNPNNASEVLQTVNLAGQPTDTGAQGMYYSVTNNNIQSVAEALQTRTGYDLLSSPRVIALSGEDAEIITGSRLGYMTKTITSSGMIESVEFLDVGTKLKITPQIKSDGSMIMSIHPEVSEGSIVNELPQKNSTETTTRLLVKDGQTIIIGGLIKDVSTETKKGVPILSDIPFLGVPFRKTSIDIEKREIIILISPHIVDAAHIADMQEPIKNIENRQKKSMGDMPGSLFNGTPAQN